MKRGGLFSLLVCFILCVILPRSANAAPTLELRMTGEFDPMTLTWIEAPQVHRTNTGFGLGALAYNLNLVYSGPPLSYTREYSNYDWYANDGLFDSSNPGDGATSSFTSIRFDTARSPANSEFSPGTGVVESMSLTILDLRPRWIYFDILSPVATNGAGEPLVGVGGLGGSINVIADPDAQGHTKAVYIPEPATILFFSLGGIFVLRKRKK